MVWLGSKLRELESLGVYGRHWKTRGVVEVVVVYSPTNHLRMEIEPAAESPQPRLERGWVMPKSEKRMTDYMGLETRSTE